MPSTAKKRKYCDDYINYGFASKIKEGKETPQCVLCYQVLSHNSMKPSLLKRHLETNHAAYSTKDRAFFERKRDTMKQSFLDRPNGPIVNLKREKIEALEASYYVAKEIAEQKKPHTIGENLVLPCAQMMVRAVVGNDAAKKLSIIPLSNNSIQRRIQEMSADIEAQVVSEIKAAQLM